MFDTRFRALDGRVRMHEARRFVFCTRPESSSTAAPLLLRLSGRAIEFGKGPIQCRQGQSGPILSGKLHISELFAFFCLYGVVKILSNGPKSLTQGQNFVRFTNFYENNRHEQVRYRKSRRQNYRFGIQEYALRHRFSGCGNVLHFVCAILIVAFYSLACVYVP